MSKKHIHNCCNPERKCACGYVFRVPPVSFSLSVFHGRTALIDEHFNCEDVWTVINALKDAIEELDAIGYGRRAQPQSVGAVDPQSGSTGTLTTREKGSE